MTLSTTPTELLALALVVPKFMFKGQQELPAGSTDDLGLWAADPGPEKTLVPSCTCSLQHLSPGIPVCPPQSEPPSSSPNTIPSALPVHQPPRPHS